MMAFGFARRKYNIPPPSPEGQRLYRYCCYLLFRLSDAGYHIVDNKQVRQALEEDAPEIGLSEKIKFVRKSNEQLVAQVSKGENAFVCSKTHLLALPESKDALKHFARRQDLNSKKLAQAGLRDIHIHAKYLIHEASHVMGREGRYWKDQVSFDANEASTYLHDMMRFMRITGFKPSDRVPNFLADYFNIQNMLGTLISREKAYDTLPDTDRYKWTSHATQWAITRANKAGFMDALWDKRGDRFYPGALQQHFAQHDFPDPGDDYGYIYDMARRYLKARIARHYAGTRKSFFNDRGDSASYAEWCNMAWRAGGDALADARYAKQDSTNRQKGNTDAEKAALILRQLARSIDHVRRYSDNYRPPARDLRITHRCSVPGHTPG